MNRSPSDTTNNERARIADPLIASIERGMPYQASTRSGAGSDSRRFSGGGATNL